MSKSILAIDAPECCDKCRLCAFGNYGAKRCTVKEQSIFFEDKKKKPDWFPLRNLPEKKPKVKYQENGCFGINEAIKNSFNMGFNSCIDEILKGVNRDE